MKNNKGYTLVELIVSVAILAVVSLGLMSFMMYGMKMYNSINDSIKLQTQSQVVMNQIREYVVDCNQGIAFDANVGETGDQVLYVWSKEGSGSKVHIFRFVKEGTVGSIYYGCVTGGASFDASATINVEDEAAADLQHKLAENVKAFEVEFLKDPDSDETNVKLTLSIKQNEKEYSGTQIIALRNCPVSGNTWSALR